jgi:hypothetical protein
MAFMIMITPFKFYFLFLFRLLLVIMMIVSGDFHHLIYMESTSESCLEVSMFSLSVTKFTVNIYKILFICFFNTISRIFVIIQVVLFL